MRDRSLVAVDSSTQADAQGFRLAGRIPDVWWSPTEVWEIRGAECVWACLSTFGIH